MPQSMPPPTDFIDVRVPKQWSPGCDFLASQPHLNARMWTILYDWLAVVSYKFGVTQVDELKWDAWRRNMTAAEREAEKNKSKEQRDAEKAARRAKEQAEKARRDAAKARKEADAKVKKAKEETDARVKKEKEAKAKRAKEVKSQRG